MIPHAEVHCAQEVFDLRKNQLFRKLFGLDLFDLVRSRNTTPKRMMPSFQCHVDIRMLEVVQTSDVLKFDWITADSDKRKIKKGNAGVTINVNA